ncbi:hypothetical protein [Microvirga terrestris]|uniref:Core-binding (CB) domain-containing protein n=1 Tax=Microvirga terrestris TaxID=2791024 RepID=A0ABS0HRK0_9HYPH|nr:hypothetical protein [Microvirga terrestris]MBF9196105.1 hypothetical protein [Microvirga terrestris]
MASVAMGTYVLERKQLNVRQIIENFLESRSGQVKQRTLKGYKYVCRYITEPLLIGTSEERAEYTTTGKLPKGTHLEPLLGDINVPDLTTAQIRSWYQLLAKEVGAFTARRAKSYLEAALKLAAEDHQLRPPAMPSNLGRGRGKEKKAILAPEQVSHLVAVAQQDNEKGIYYAFPSLTGTRPSEQLALL